MSETKKTRICADVADKYIGVARQALTDVQTLAKKNEAYGDSWKQRGGRGAWFTLVRPWDRLEQMVLRAGEDIFAAGDLVHEDPDSDILDSIRDVRNYLFLVEREIKDRRKAREALISPAERMAKVGRDASEQVESAFNGMRRPFGFDPDDD